MLDSFPVDEVGFRTTALEHGDVNVLVLLYDLCFHYDGLALGGCEQGFH
jgi:hypothetical protein